MAKLSNVGTRIWLDQYDLSGFLNSGEQTVNQELIRAECFSDTGPHRIVGNHDHKHSHNGFFDGAEDQIDEILDALRESPTDHYLAHLWGANAEGGIVYESLVRLSSKPISGANGGAVLLNTEFEGAGGISRGMILRNATVSANGNGTGRNVGATTLGQVFQVVFRVFSGTFTSFDLKIQESANDGSPDAYADVAGLAQTGIAAPGVWRVTTTAATEAWKRVVVANWNGTNAVIGVTAGYVAGT